MMAELDLQFDADALDEIAGIISAYCGAQKMHLESYLGDVLACSDDWTDEQSFAPLLLEVEQVKNSALQTIEEIESEYPAYFRSKAEALRARPTMDGGGGGFASGSGVGTYGGVTSTNAGVPLKNVTLGIGDLNGTGARSYTLPDKRGKRPAFPECKDEDFVKNSVASARKISYINQRYFSEYSGDTYTRINGYLRGKQEMVSSDRSYREWIQEIIDGMSSEMETQELPTDMKLYRGLSSPRCLFDDGWERMSLSELQEKYVGKVFSDKAFCSTSTKREAALDFAKTWDGTMIEIDAPKGANGVFMGSMSKRNQANGNDEKEVLLQKGSVFRITGIEADKDARFKITTQLIGRE